MGKSDRPEVQEAVSLYRVRHPIRRHWLPRSVKRASSRPNDAPQLSCGGPSCRVPVGLVHAAGNTVAIAHFTASWLRRRGNRCSGALWSTLGIAVATLGGLLGSHLAYALGVGVDTSAFETGPNEWTAARGDVPTEPLVARALDGVRVMVAQNEEGRFTLADRCSNGGGPSSEGTLDRGCVTCPWHAHERPGVSAPTRLREPDPRRQAGTAPLRVAGAPPLSRLNGRSTLDAGTSTHADGSVPGRPLRRRKHG